MFISPLNIPALIERLYSTIRLRKPRLNAEKRYVLRNNIVYIVIHSFLMLLLGFLIYLMTGGMSKDIHIPYVFTIINYLTLLWILSDIAENILEKVEFDQAGVYSINGFGHRKAIPWSSVQEIQYKMEKTLVVISTDGTRVEFTYVMNGFMQLIEEIQKHVSADKRTDSITLFFEKIDRHN